LQSWAKNRKGLMCRRLCADQSQFAHGTELRQATSRSALDREKGAGWQGAVSMEPDNQSPGMLLTSS